MSSTIYNHRSLQPTGAAPPPPGGPPAGNLAVAPAAARFDELLDTLKHAYDDAHRETIALKMQRDEYEAKINAQVNELNHIRQSLYELEAAHKAVRLRYEDEFARLTQELANRPAAPPAGGPAPPAAYPSDYEREREDREREREHNRERDRAARDREREIRDREREIQREKDRDIRERDREMRPADARAPDFHSSKRATTSAPAPRDKPSAPPASAPPTKTERERERPADPANKSYGWDANSPTSPPRASASTSAAPSAPAAAPAPHPEPMDLEEIVHPDCKKEGGDWFAVFNPKAKRALDVSLTLTLAHERSVHLFFQFGSPGWCGFLAATNYGGASLLGIKPSDRGLEQSNGSSIAEAHDNIHAWGRITSFAQHLSILNVDTAQEAEVSLTFK